MTAAERLNSIRSRQVTATNPYAAPDNRRDARLKLERDDVPAMVDALTKVLELHRRAHAVFSWASGQRYEEPCPECDGRAGVHPCGCWADSDIEYVCAECHRLGSSAKGVYDYTYPCPTVRAIDSALTPAQGTTA